MGNAKQDALKMISNMPDAVNFEDIMYRLYVLESVAHAESEVASGVVISQDELRKKVGGWLK